MPSFVRSFARAIAFSSALAALFVAMPSAHATCIEDCKADLMFDNCTTPPMGTWPFGTQLTFAASCQTCCSPPGGPVSCSPSPVDLKIFSVQDANFTPIAGTFAPKNLKCQDIDLYSFDGPLAMGQTNLIIGNLIVQQFEVVESGGGAGGSSSSSSSSSSGSSGGAGGTGGGSGGETSSSSSSTGSSSGSPAQGGNGSGSQWGCSMTPESANSDGLAWAFVAIGSAVVALRRRRSTTERSSDERTWRAS